jgi:deazaflavin-dependent oxidoreductase (nitroreductase family)
LALGSNCYEVASAPMGLMQWYVKRLAPKRSVALLNAKILPPIDRVAERFTGRSASGRVVPTLMLTTTGRKSGQPRTTPLLYVEHDGGWVVIGTNFGQEHHPAWTGNLLARPEAEVQVDGRTVPVTARGVSDEEFAELWPRFVRIYPGYEDYRGRLERDARMFHLSPE